MSLKAGLCIKLGQDFEVGVLTDLDALVYCVMGHLSVSVAV